MDQTFAIPETGLGEIKAHGPRIPSHNEADFSVSIASTCWLRP